MLTASERAAVIDRILADPPAVHAMDFSDNPEIGVWRSDRDCYEYLASQCRDGSRTLETGSGVSTVLLTALGTEHTCVTPSQAEVDRLRAYMASHDIAEDRTTFEVGGSDEVLPRLNGPLDLVFVDGGHGFPTPLLDWYYAGQRLGRGGLLVFDDMHLPAVTSMRYLLERDPRWELVTLTPKWSAWRRLDEGPLGEDWVTQPWFRSTVLPPRREIPGWLVRRVAREFQRHRPRA
jgi:predicted O-methyltransferase YrrM